MPHRKASLKPYYLSSYLNRSIGTGSVSALKQLPIDPTDRRTPLTAIRQPSPLQTANLCRNGSPPKFARVRRDARRSAGIHYAAVSIHALARGRTVPVQYESHERGVSNPRPRFTPDRPHSRRAFRTLKHPKTAHCCSSFIRHSSGQSPIIINALLEFSGRISFRKKRRFFALPPNPSAIF